MDIEADITNRAVSELKSLLGEKLRRVILYGSYARGDFHEESDVDIMVLLDVEREQVPKYRTPVRRISGDIGIDNNIYVSIMVQSFDFFFKELKLSHFYRNVMKDGKELYCG
ncbi:MAG: nucleotidyltransferase domain-containing protein [Chitinispirillia bacterium]|nr:nucleotidyltransferase domain-containing protein [Chitinispirillia bacterium]MCL2269218.1 nucleotidyltransferase domain-containing protein [Chitinispirillia bacterium]